MESIESLKAENQLLKEEIRKLTVKQSTTENNKEINGSKFFYRTFDKERTKFPSRDEMLTLLLRMNKTEDELKSITNYKGLLEDELNKINYDGRFSYLCILEWFVKNNILDLKPMDEEMVQTKLKILDVIRKRQEDYERRRKGELLL
jgi:hypothetical protein